VLLLRLDCSSKDLGISAVRDPSVRGKTLQHGTGEAELGWFTGNAKLGYLLNRTDGAEAPDLSAAYQSRL
jgi:hypothetical protein